MELMLLVGGLRLETAGYTRIQLGKWTLHYSCERHPRGFWHRAAWRDDDSELATTWTVLALNREWILSRAKPRTPEQIEAEHRRGMEDRSAAG